MFLRNTDIFINESNDVLTDSLRVAVKFEKDHSKVIRSIDDLLEKSYSVDTECNPKMDLHKMFGNYILLCTISKTIKGHMIMYPFIILCNSVMITFGVHSTPASV
jgi:phage regulator Rha-like protein